MCFFLVKHKKEKEVTWYFNKNMKTYEDSLSIVNAIEIKIS